VESLRVDVNGVGLDVHRAGPATGAAVVLLHGFPEYSGGWRRQVGPLAAAGYRVVVPDQRGYAGSGKPRGVAAYSLDRLADDVIAVLEAAAGADRRATLVGHDWGGLVAWWTALRHPARVERLCILNAPHPVAFREYLRTHPSQRRRSRYIGFFQVPVLPEAVLGARDCALLRRTLVRSSRRGTFTPADLEGYLAAWRQPGALTGMLNWYRALTRARPSPPASLRVACPALILWGERDAFLETGLATASAAYCERGTVRTFPAATHWLQHEEAPAVNAALLDFLGAG